MAREIIGLDIGSSSVKGARVRRHITGWKLAELKEVAIPEGEGAHQALRELAREWNLPGVRWVVSLPGDRAFWLGMTLPFSRFRDLAQVIPYEMERHLLHSGEGSHLDYSVCSLGAQCSEVAGLALPRETLEEFLLFLSEAEVSPWVVEADPFYLYRLARDIVKEEEVVALADLGHSRTNLVILKGPRLAVARTLAQGSQAITQALSQSLGPGEVDKLKCQLDLADPGGVQAQLARGALAPLLRELWQSISAFEASEKCQVDRLHLAGAGAAMAGLCQFFSRELDKPVNLLEPREVWNLDPPVTSYQALLFAKSLALARRGMERSRYHQVNLKELILPGVVRLGMPSYRARTLALVCLAAFLSLVWSTSSYLQWQAREVQYQDVRKAKEEVFSQLLPGVKAQGTEALILKERIARLKQELTGLSALEDSRISPLAALKEITQKLPREGNLAVKEFIFDKGKVKLSGQAPTFQVINDIAESLKTGQGFAEVKISKAETSKEGKGVTFELDISL